MKRESESRERPGAQAWVPDRADLDSLRDAAPSCRGCELWEPATQVVFSTGEARARVALVGEQPGDIEDREGVPFVGPEGRVLRRAMDEVGLRWEDLYVTNAVKHFRFTTRGKRRIHDKPQVAHIRACRPWLEAEIRVVDPRIVVVLGATAATAATAILGPQFRVTKDRGALIDVEFAGGDATVPPGGPSFIDPARPGFRARGGLRRLRRRPCGDRACVRNRSVRRSRADARGQQLACR